MLHIVLYQPEIPGNTGNIIRLCANTGARLHLIRPLGFDLEDSRLRRAGLDYHEWADVRVHDELDSCLQELCTPPARVFALTTKGSRWCQDVAFAAGDILLFGPETRGLPAEVLARFDGSTRLRLPMLPQSRSLNLGNAVAIVVYEAWRQLGFAGAV